LLAVSQRKGLVSTSAVLRNGVALASVGLSDVCLSLAAGQSSHGTSERGLRGVVRVPEA
jgi:hypothetical protein